MQEKKNDELLDCLVIFTKLHNNPYTADALVAGLPTNENHNYRYAKRLKFDRNRKAKRGVSRL